MMTSAAPRPFFSALAGVFALTAWCVTPAQAHSLDTRSTSLQFSTDFVQTMTQRGILGQPLLQTGDEFWVLIKTTPGPGTPTGVGGYQTFYVPEGVKVLDVAQVLPDTSDPRGFRTIPLKGQSPIALGSGSAAASSTPELIGFTLPGTNGLGFKTDPVTATGLDRGTIAGVYADTGIFYSTDPRTAFNSYGVVRPPLTGGPAPMRNNSGDTVGEYWAANVAGSQGVNLLGVMTEWDAQQLRAYGSSSPAVSIVDPGDNRGNLPWGLGNAVAGPQSGYAWEFDLDTYNSTVGTHTQKMRAAIKIGPWNRIKYPGSQISQDTPGSSSAVIGNVGIDASQMGIEPSQIPEDTTAIRFAIGQIELGRPEYSAVKVRIKPGFDPNICGFIDFYGDAFGGDAGGTSGGKDHIWRYFDPTAHTLSGCTLLQKAVSKNLVAPGETFFYTITFANNGNVAIPNVSIRDTLPTGIVHVSATPSPTTSAPPVYTWNLGTVAPNSIVSITQYVRATGTGTLYNTARAFSGTELIGVAEQSVEVGTRAILLKDKSVTPSNSAPGGTVRYTLNVENIGTGPNGVPMVIRDYLPPGFTYSGSLAATLNGAAISSPTITVNATNTAVPVFTVSQAILPSQKLVISFNALIGAGVTPGTYWNQFEVDYEGKRIPPIPEAPVTVGGGQIGDFVWRDWNGNGLQDSGEEGLPGVVVGLYQSDGTTLITTRTTDANGAYLFSGLQPGTYVVRVNSGVPAGYTLTEPVPTAQRTIVLTANQVNLTADFGYQPGGTGVINGLVFSDPNKNAVYDGGDALIPSVLVRLYEDTNGNGLIDIGDLLITTTSSNGSGAYSFTGLATGLNYLVQVDSTDSDLVTFFAPNSYSNTTPNLRSVLNLSGTVSNQNFGFFGLAPASVGDQVFLDLNRDGIYNAGDLPIAGVPVTLYNSSNTPVATTTTSATGTYLFSDLAPGSYTVGVDYLSTAIPVGYETKDTSLAFTLTSGQNLLTIDFPFATYLQKTVDKSFAQTNETVTFSLRSYAPASGLVTDLRVTDPLPAGVTYVGGSANAGGTFGTYVGLAGVPGTQSNIPADDQIGMTNTLTVSTNFVRVTGTSNVVTVSMNLRSASNLTNVVPQLNVFGGKPGFFSVSGPTPASTNITASSAATHFTWQVTLHRVGEYRFEADATDGGGTGDNDAPTALSATVLGVDTGGPQVIRWNIGSNTRPTNAETVVAGAPAGVYSFLGGTNTFRRYNIVSDTWTTLSNAPANIGAGADIVRYGTNPILFATRGGNTQAFYSYNVTNNTWTTLANVGANVDTEGNLTYLPVGGTNFVFATEGGGNGFRRYNITNNTWGTLANAPASLGAGSGMATDGTNIFVTRGANRNNLYRYNVASNNWTTMANAPAKINRGADMIHLSGFLYATRGGNKVEFYRYSIASNSWTRMANVPGGVDTGGALTSDGTNIFAYRGLTGGYYRYNVASNNWTLLNPSATNIAAGGSLHYAPEFQASGYSTRLAATPPVANPGDTVTVSMVLSNSTGTAISNMVPTTLGIATTNGATATYVSGPTPSSATVPANGAVTNIWTYTINPGANPGSVTFSAGATNGTVTFPTAVANSVLVAPVLTFQGTVNNPAPTNGVIFNLGILSDDGQELGSVPSNKTQTATSGSIGDTVFNDLNGDGTQNPGENGMAGVRVNIYAADGVTLLQSQITDGAGNYLGTNLAPGTYVLRLDPTTIPAGYFSTTATSFTRTIVGAQQILDADFGLQLLAPGTGSIGDRVWVDADNNGVQDSGEAGIPGISLTLQREISPGTWSQVATTTTDASGNYTFGGLPSGTYRVLVDTNSQVTSPYASGTFNLGSAMAPTYDLDGVGTANVASVVLPTNSTVIDTLDFGYNWTGVIGDFVWWDYNTNGLQDEVPLVGIENARVQLYFDADGDGVYSALAGDYEIKRVFTDASGFYSFQNLPPGRYFVDVYEDSIITGGIRNVVPTTVDVIKRTLGAGETNLNNDFGYFVGARVEANVFWDRNGNGIRDGGEDLLSGVIVNLVGTDLFGNPVNVSNTTDANGNVAFLVPEGNYTISYSQPQATTVYPALGTTTTATSFTFFAQAGEDGFRSFDFGLDNTGSISGIVFGDLPTTGTLEGSDPRLAGITVNLYRDLNGDGVIDLGAGDQLLAITTTDALGRYSFTGLEDTAGGARYMVEVVTTTLGSTYETTPTTYPVGTVLATSRYSTPLTGGAAITNLDFGYPLVPDVYYTVGGVIYNDNGDGGGTASDGIRNGTEPGIPGVTVLVQVDTDNDNVFDQSFSTTTAANGSYSVGGILEGSNVRVTVNPTTLPSTAYGQTGDPDGAPLSNVFNITNLQADRTDLNFGYREVLATISGTVVKDANGNGIADSGEVPVADVSVTLTYAGPDNIIGTSDDVTTPTTTNGSGAYSFTGLVPGVYEIVKTNPSGFISVADRDGFNPTIINLTILPGNPLTGVADNKTGQDFEIGNRANITGRVLIDTDLNGTGDTPLANVTLTLVDANGTPVLEGGNPVTTLTDSNGNYVFNGVVAGTYGVRASAVADYLYIGDNDGGVFDWIGDTTDIILAAGTDSVDNNFLLRTQACPNTWAAWQAKWGAGASPLTNLTPTGNDDADIQNNLIEYAFCLDPKSGRGTPYCMSGSLESVDKVDLVFRRTAGGPLDITFELEHAATLGANSTTWTTAAIPPANIEVTRRTNGTDSVRIKDLEAITGLTAGTGFIRIKVTLRDPDTNNVIATASTDVGGWIQTPLDFEIRSFNDPFLDCPLFTGTITAIEGQNLVTEVSGGGLDYAPLLAGQNAYAEILTGPLQGHRFDVAGGSTNRFTAVVDNDIYSGTAPFSTAASPQPELVGAQFVVRPHRTVGNVFPPRAFVATDDPESASIVQMYAGNRWETFWLYDDGGGQDAQPAWISVGDSTLTDRSADTLVPGQGGFIYSRKGAQIGASFMLSGKVRPNDFIRPLKAGLNNVGGGYPLVQSAAGRAMTYSDPAHSDANPNGFIGTNDFKTADQFLIWRMDSARTNAPLYDTWFLLNRTARLPILRYWTPTSVATLPNVDAMPYFKPDYSILIKRNNNNPAPANRMPAPWKP